MHLFRTIVCAAAFIPAVVSAQSTQLSRRVDASTSRSMKLVSQPGSTTQLIAAKEKGYQLVATDVAHDEHAVSSAVQAWADRVAPELFELSSQGNTSSIRDLAHRESVANLI